MKTCSNLHTHSVFCDGKNTIEEMVLEALSKGFESIGFSSHAYTGYSFDECGIPKDRIDEYFGEIERVKELYGDRILIYSGLELESRVLGEGRPEIDARTDYTIGSCHFYRNGGKFFSVDYTPEEALAARDSFGSSMALLESYYEEMASFAEESSFDIVGHIDLPSKFNEKMAEPLFEETEEYRRMVLRHVDRIISTGKIFEVNTGAISRGWRTSPYPSRFILERLLERKAPVIISSDCHDKDYLAESFGETEEMLRRIGFREQMKLTPEGFISTPL